MTHPIKVLILGASGSGKTGMLPALLAAGYNVRMWDADNGSALVRTLAKDHIDRLSTITLTEKFSPMGGTLYPVQPKCWVRLVESIREWKGDNGENLGAISTWGPQDVLVVDTASTIARLAYYYSRKQAARETAPETGKLWQADIGNAQTLALTLMDMLHGEDIKCNVVVNCHINRSYPDGSRPNDMEVAQALAEKRSLRLNGYPNLIGAKAGPRVPVFFTDMLYLKRDGATATLYTSPIDDIDVKTSAPGKVKRTYKQTTGLAEYFADVRSAFGEITPKEPAA